MSKDKKRGSDKRKGFFIWFLISLGRAFWFILRIPYFVIIYVYLLVKSLCCKTKVPSASDIAFVKGKIKSSSEDISKNVSFDVLDSLKGEFKDFVSYIKKNDSFIAITIGARGAGKTATSLSFMEKLRGSKKNYFAMGFSRDALPDWIFLVEDISKIKNDSLVLVDEGGILFSSRETMSSANKLLSDLLMISRHKNISIIFISQNSSNLEINTLRQADVLILKKHSLLQKNFERKIIAKLYEEYESGFEKFKLKKGLSLIYADKFIGFVDVSLPSFWSDKTSKSFESVHSSDSKRKKNDELK
ncbi:MAG: zonular occludens toxin domain-containing protein [Candidatus Woesearchaeota archaeon]